MSSSWRGAEAASWTMCVKLRGFRPEFSVISPLTRVEGFRQLTMRLSTTLTAAAAALLFSGSGTAVAQVPNKPASALTESELREVLVWNSPWEGAASVPGKSYSYRTTFRARRETLLAEVVSYSTNERADSVVTLQNGRLTWQDSNGADVTVTLADAGELVGTASTKNASVPIVLKPRR
ncbi:MAG TPA: hypothetical protein VHP37_10890 [Burkholderiales bacterium]|nr:hypothetical protein [Burkholderiales bacterium]